MSSSPIPLHDIESAVIPIDSDNTIPDRYVNHTPSEKSNSVQSDQSLHTTGVLGDYTMDIINLEDYSPTVNLSDENSTTMSNSISSNNSIESEIRHIEKNQDRNQMIQVYILFMIEIFKVAMASFLSMSVIQNCGGEVCGYSENLHRHTSFGKLVVGVNSFNIVAFSILYFYEFTREMFLIQYLDIDKRVGDYHLPAILDQYVDISNRLKRYNNVYYICTRVLLCLTSINWILSGILVFGSFYSLKTITSFATNILLVITKLSDSYRVSKESAKHNYGLSAYMKEYMSFNVIDKDYVNS
jgi:hypothetical protein